MKIYFQQTEVKEKQRKCSREHMRRKRHPSETKIKDLLSYIQDIKAHPDNFPQEEFSKRLDEIIKENPLEIEEKELKDALYDILEKKGNLSPNGLFYLYNGNLWTNAVDEFMKMRNYSRIEDKYLFTIPQILQI